MTLRLTGSYKIQIWGGDVITMELVDGEMPCVRPPFVARFYTAGTFIGDVQIKEILLPGRSRQSEMVNKTHLSLVALGELPFSGADAESGSIEVTLDAAERDSTVDK